LTLTERLLAAATGSPRPAASIGRNSVLDQLVGGAAAAVISISSSLWNQLPGKGAALAGM